MAVSKRTRFEVFKRDSFTCQYCGRAAPDVILNADHIDPRAHGGADEILNLITSCWDCNSGKSDKKLSDNSAVAKQKLQLDQLQERHSQIEMMMQWKMGLCDLANQEAENVTRYFEQVFEVTVNESAIPKLRLLVKKFTSARVIEAIDRAMSFYSDANIAFEKLGGICTIIKRCETDPAYDVVSRTGAILRNRGFHVNYGYLSQVLREAVINNVNKESIYRWAKEAKNWTVFISGVETYNSNYCCQDGE